MSKDSLQEEVLGVVRHFFPEGEKLSKDYSFSPYELADAIVDCLKENESPSLETKEVVVKLVHGPFRLNIRIFDGIWTARMFHVENEEKPRWESHGDLVGDPMNVFYALNILLFDNKGVLAD